MQISKRHTRPPAYPRRSGFTLIELLTVIAIIAILAGMLFPTFSRARENGRRTSCLSNMKQLGLGFAQYIGDYDGRYPGGGQFQRWGNGGHWVSGVNDPNPVGNPDPGTGRLANLGDFKWTGHTANVEGGAIYSYVKNAQVYVCPSNTDSKNKRLAYSMNCAIAGINEAAIDEASSIILLVDEDKANDGWWYASAGSTDALFQLHNGGGNLLFVDGHAKFYPFTAYPLDASPNSAPLKTRLTGTPRFHDGKFGPGGSYDGSAAGFGSCADPEAPIVTPTPVPTAVPVPTVLPVP